jgi:hypothetical protein
MILIFDFFWINLRIGEICLFPVHALTFFLLCHKLKLGRLKVPGTNTIPYMFKDVLGNKVP